MICGEPMQISQVVSSTRELWSLDSLGALNSEERGLTLNSFAGMTQIGHLARHIFFLEYKITATL